MEDIKKSLEMHVEADGCSLGGIQYMERRQEEQVAGMTEWGEQEMGKNNRRVAEPFPEEEIKDLEERKTKSRSCDWKQIQAEMIKQKGNKGWEADRRTERWQMGVFWSVTNVPHKN